MKGQRVSLGNITVPVLNVLAKFDHIVPDAQSLPVADLVGSDDVTTEVVHAGHIGIMAGGKARNVLWPSVSARLGERCAKETQ